jgi:hypothetical protein
MFIYIIPMGLMDYFCKEAVFYTIDCYCFEIFSYNNNLINN